MHTKSIPLVLLALFSSTFASAVSPRQGADTTVICGQFDSLVEGPFTLFNDQFGSASAASGSQCAEVTSLSEDNTVSWVTNWTWVNNASGGGVKSFANINLNEGVGVQLSIVQSIPVGAFNPSTSFFLRGDFEADRKSNIDDVGMVVRHHGYFGRRRCLRPFHCYVCRP